MNSTQLISDGPGAFIDSHAPINATAAYGATNGGPQARDSAIVLNNVTFTLENGRAIVTGSADAQTKPNGGGYYVSYVTLNNPELDFAGPPQFGSYGLIGYHSNWHSIYLTLIGGTVRTTGGAYVPIVTSGNEPERMIDFVTTVNTPNYAAHVNGEPGLAKFVNYWNPFAIVDPGRTIVVSHNGTILTAHAINP